MKITKGAQVRLRTTNGGDTVVTLLEDYVPTYSATLATSHGSWFSVEAWRIKSIEVVDLNAEYARKTQVAAQMADSTYRSGGLNGMHAELAFLRRSDADPVVIGEFERLYHAQIKISTPLTHALRERVNSKRAQS
jgi:hypothetical protein